MKNKRVPPKEKAQPPKEEPQPPKEEPQPPKEERSPKYIRPEEATINAARAFWVIRDWANGRPCPSAVIDNTSVGDDTMWKYFKKQSTFSGAEVYIKFDIDTAASAPRHAPSRCKAAAEQWWQSQDASARTKNSKYPLARIHGDDGADYTLQQFFKQNGTFTGATIHIMPFCTVISEDSEYDARKRQVCIRDCGYTVNFGYEYQ